MSIGWSRRACATSTARALAGPSRSRLVSGFGSEYSMTCGLFSHLHKRDAHRRRRIECDIGLGQNSGGTIDLELDRDAGVLPFGEHIVATRIDFEVARRAADRKRVLEGQCSL